MCAPPTSRWAGLVWAVKLTATGAAVLMSIALMARVSGIGQVLLAVAATAGAMTPVLWAGWWVGRPHRRVPPRAVVTASAEAAQPATVRLWPVMAEPAVESVRVVVEPSAVIIPDPAPIGRPMRALPVPVPPRRHVATRRALR
jgi:hypothetical protein